MCPIGNYNRYSTQLIDTLRNFYFLTQHVLMIIWMIVTPRFGCSMYDMDISGFTVVYT